MIGPSSAGTPLCDPSLFDDPLAERILWSPLKKQGATSRCTHRARMRRKDRLDFQPTWQWRACVVAMLLAAVALPVAGAVMRQGGGTLETELALFGAGFVLGGVGVYFYRDLREPRVFDRRRGYFLLGGHDRQRRPVSDLHALQIVSRYVHGDDTPDYYCHELNVVLKSAARLNVIAHGSYRDLLADAETLSEFLNVPVWDQAQFV